MNQQVNKTNTMLRRVIILLCIFMNGTIPIMFFLGKITEILEINGMANLSINIA